MKKTIATEDAPKAIGPYSQAIEVNSMVFCSGQLGIDPAAGELEGDLNQQTRRILTNIQAVLKASGCGMNDVIKATVFLTDMKDFAEFNAIYGEFFTAPYPARSTVQVAALPKNARLEIEVIAVKP